MTDSGGEHDLRSFLERLLAPGAEATDLLEDPALQDAFGEALAPLAREIASVLLSLRTPRDWAIPGPQRIIGLHRLRLLTGCDDPAGREIGEYDRLRIAMQQMGKAGDGVFDDPIAADLLLCRLAELRRPEAWKIAIGLNGTEPEAETVARRCLEGGFAAIAPSDQDDMNIARLKRLVPGDCVVMHLRGRIGAIGRVTRPYHEIDRERAAPFDRRWCRRIGVEWLEGDREYGQLLSGAQQRFSVVRLEPDVFRAIADLYRHEAGYDRLIRPLRGAWVFRCNDTRWRTLRSLDKPLPLRDEWTVTDTGRGEVGGAEPEPGDLVFLYHQGEDETATGGICGVARVVNETQRTSRGERGTRRLDLIYERLVEECVPASVLDDDPRTDGWRPPEGGQVGWLTPGSAAALRAYTGPPSDEHFVLIVDGSRRSIGGGEVTCRLDQSTSGRPADLLRGCAESNARCLIYHGPPENSFIGFGRVGEIARPGAVGSRNGCHELRIDATRLSREGGGLRGLRMSRQITDQALSEATVSDSDGLVRTVLHASAYDFYRVVGAGMVYREASDTTSGLEHLADRTGAPIARLEEMERLLREEGQMILYGPPGTGKTWLALQMADYLTGGDEERQDFVQFHPSYSYEDLMEGIRPQVVETADGGNSLDYPLVPGSFKAFCDRARRDPYATYLFVIDEINRARVAQVFGELMMALEYRGRHVQLAHRSAGPQAGDGLFCVPRNVLVVATMNTADRSTAFVDYALRRRFIFYPLYPDDLELVRPMFRTWLARNAPDASWVAELLDRVNEWLASEVGRHLLIGHTYFMREGLVEADVREIWRFQIRPLLEEYFASAPERLEELDLDELIDEARAASPGRVLDPRAQREGFHDQLWWEDAAREGR